jgi:hypothetical protein
VILIGDSGMGKSNLLSYTYQWISMCIRISIDEKLYIYIQNTYLHTNIWILIYKYIHIYAYIRI